MAKRIMGRTVGTTLNPQTLIDRTKYEELITSACEEEVRKLKESGEINGKDGVSLSHRWHGTTLSITSANGTTSVDLRGEKGDQGVAGEQGPKGDPGKDAEGALRVTYDTSTMKASHTSTEILAANEAGRLIYFVAGTDFAYLQFCNHVIARFTRIEIYTAEDKSLTLEETYTVGQDYTVSKSEKIIKVEDFVKTVNGIAPDEDGNVQIEVESGGGAAIIDVLELPADNIDENSLYRLLRAMLIQNQYVQVAFACHCVETLPSTGEPATNLDQTQGNVYYCLSDNQAYGYVDSTLSTGMGVPSGWYPVATLLGALGYGYGGIITDFADDLNDDKFRLYLEYDLYSYKDKWILLDNIDKVGAGVYSNISNHPLNDASGNYSSAEGFLTKAQGMCSHAEGRNTTAEGKDAHAEGNGTTAEGICSHAEGDNTHAEGQNAHAEGRGTHAKGICSHAEGDNTTAEGYYSHAEGFYTVASGRASHAEGSYTKASSDYQHVQGKCNIEDTNYIYAHIVGNGTSTDNLSNAHTLDWNGNAWYAGVVRVGGTSYDDAKEVATKEWVNELLGGIENGTY